MKKKIIAVAMIIVCTRFSLFAESTKISIAGVWHADTVKVGGGFEIGFPIVEKNLIVRDYITINGYGGTVNALSFGECSIANKFQLGGRVNLGTYDIVSYGLVNLEFGLYGASGKKFFAAPFILDIGGGGGFELRYQITEKIMQSFFVEFGGGGMFKLSKTSSGVLQGYASLAIGYRTYF